MKNVINPVGLKGNEINERMKELMGLQSINEINTSRSVVELTKLGPDGNVYGIVRENHEYYIKISKKTKSLVNEDFSYIGGLKNKKEFAYPSYAKAIKQLNLKFNSLNEAYEKIEKINIFEDDNLMADVKEGETKSNPWAICTSSVGREDKEKYEKCVKDIKKEKGIDENITEAEFNDEPLTEVEQEVEDMVDEKEEETVKPVTEHRLSIAKSINEMDNIIDSVVNKNKKKVYTIL